MPKRMRRVPFGVWWILCCMVPLAALAVTFYLNVPATFSVLVAVMVLIPLARALLHAAAHHPRG